MLDPGGNFFVARRTVVLFGGLTEGLLMYHYEGLLYQNLVLNPSFIFPNSVARVLAPFKSCCNTMPQTMPIFLLWQLPINRLRHPPVILFRYMPVRRLWYLPVNLLRYPPINQLKRRIRDYYLQKSVSKRLEFHLLLERYPRWENECLFMISPSPSGKVNSIIPVGLTRCRSPGCHSPTRFICSTLILQGLQS